MKLMAESVLFGDFFDSADPGSQNRIYRPLSDENKLVRVLEEYHMRMNIGDTVCVCGVFFLSDFHLNPTVINLSHLLEKVLYRFNNSDILLWG